MKNRRMATTALSLFAVSVLALSACSSGDSSSAESGGAAPSATAGDETAAATPSEPYEIAFIPGVANDAYYGSVQCGIEAVANEFGANVTTQAPKSFSPTDQIPILQAVIATNPDALIIAPTDAKALYAPLKKAVDQGITLVLVDTTLEDPSIAVAQVTSDNVAAGEVAAQTLIELLGEKAGSVMTVNTSPGVSTVEEREKGFAQGLAVNAALKYLGQEFSDNSVQKANSIVAAKLVSNPDLVGIFSTAAFNTEGAVSALKASDRDDVTIVGFNANPSGIDQIKDGTVAAQVVLKPYDGGIEAAKQAFNALEGKPVTPITLTGAVVANKANLESPEVQKYLYSFTCPTS